MKELIERVMYKDINDFIEQISYFAAKDIAENNNKEGDIEFDVDMLDLIETFCNCKHVHQEILKEIETETERELFRLGWFGKPIKVYNGKIHYEKE